MAISDTRLYNIWSNMKRRCYDPKNKYYHRYGGRGITYCEKWEKSQPFIDWALSNGYSDGLTLDRIDNDGNYCPENCRWILMKEQANNTCKTRYIEHEGVRRTITEWAEITGLKQSTIYFRLAKGWASDQILAPIQRKPRYITYKGETKTLAEWARIYNMTPNALAYRLSTGKSLDECFSNTIYKKLTARGETRTLREWYKITGTYPDLIRSRLRYGMSVEDAIFTPIKK